MEEKEKKKNEKKGSEMPGQNRRLKAKRRFMFLFTLARLNTPSPQHQRVPS